MDHQQGASNHSNENDSGVSSDAWDTSSDSQRQSVQRQGYSSRRVNPNSRPPAVKVFVPQRPMPTPSNPPTPQRSSNHQPSKADLPKPDPPQSSQLPNNRPPTSMVQKPHSSPTNPHTYLSARRRVPTSRSKFFKSWQFWTVIGLVTCSGVGWLAIALLLKLPAVPNCPSIFWPTASASLRLYCAEVAANKKTVDDLLQAIALVDSLPENHPMRSEIDRSIEQWSLQILELADDTFDQGQLDEAIATVRQIPSDTVAYQQVEEQIERWQTLWKDAEAIETKAKEAVQQLNFREASNIAVQLLSVDNTYWRTQKYEELNLLITAVRNDASKLTQAQTLARRGGLSNFQEAIKLAEAIKPTSPVYQRAQDAIVDFGKKMYASAEAKLDARDAQGAIAIVRQIPDKAGLRREVEDFTTIALAYTQAWEGTAANLEAAILRAQRLGSDRPLYERAQNLIRRWQLEIDDLRYIEAAKQTAATGTVPDLRAAINEAAQVPRGNPRWQESRDLIAQWTTRIETVEDGPYLEQARRLAANGDVDSLQAAVNEASKIRQGRTLYAEARGLIREWTTEIEDIQDQPLLTRARQLASIGDLQDAIATAEQIQSGRSLYDEAQADIQDWRGQIEGQVRLREAYQSANAGTPAMLLNAIRTAQQVPANSPARAEAEQMINIWSQSILQMAIARSPFSLQEAIQIAESIPPQTEAYAAAQLQIEAWRQTLTQPTISPTMLPSPSPTLYQ